MARISSLAEAVEATVHDGDTLAVEGLTHLIPHAVGPSLAVLRGYIGTELTKEAA